MSLSTDSRLSLPQFRSSLDKSLGHARHDGERVVVTDYKQRPIAALVPIEDLELLELLEKHRGELGKLIAWSGAVA